MAKGAWIKKEEKLKIATLASIPTMTARAIANAMGRDESTIYSVMANDNFKKFIEEKKNIIDQRRAEMVDRADKTLNVKLEELDPRELIGLSKVFYEQLFFPPPTSINIQGEKIAVVIQQGATGDHSDPETASNP